MSSGISMIVSNFKNDFSGQMISKSQQNLKTLIALDLEKDKQNLNRLRENLSGWQKNLLDAGGLYDKRSPEEKELDQFIEICLASVYKNEYQSRIENPISSLWRSFGNRHGSSSKVVHRQIIRQLKWTNDVLHLQSLSIKDAFQFVSLLRNAVDKLVCVLFQGVESFDQELLRAFSRLALGSNSETHDKVVFAIVSFESHITVSLSMEEELLSSMWDILIFFQFYYQEKKIPFCVDSSQYGIFQRGSVLNQALKYIGKITIVLGEKLSYEQQADVKSLASRCRYDSSCYNFDPFGLATTTSLTIFPTSMHGYLRFP
eukprot:765999-Hanusia_phi.AAC.4